MTNGFCATKKSCIVLQEWTLGGLTGLEGFSEEVLDEMMPNGCIGVKWGLGSVEGRRGSQRRREARDLVHNGNHILSDQPESNGEAAIEVSQI